MRLLTPQDVAAEHRPFVEGMDALGSFINLYRVMAHSPVALRRLTDLLGYLWSGAVSDRIREIAILSVVSASDAPYPLGWHLLDGADAGLTAGEIEAVIGGGTVGLPPDDAAVAQFARELTLDARVSDAAFRVIAEFMDERQIVELTMIVGLYRMVACFANGLSVELDDAPAGALNRLRGETA